MLESLKETPRCEKPPAPALALHRATPPPRESLSSREVWFVHWQLRLFHGLVALWWRGVRCGLRHHDLLVNGAE